MSNLKFEYRIGKIMAPIWIGCLGIKAAIRMAANDAAKAIRYRDTAGLARSVGVLEVCLSTLRRRLRRRRSR